MKLDKLLESSSRTAHPRLAAVFGLAVLAALQLAVIKVRADARRQMTAAAASAEALDDAQQSLAENQSLLELREKDLSEFKGGLSKLAQSRRALYESGLELQEELRLLQKQWEILTTYLLVDEGARKISLMRGEQALETYPIGYAPEGFGGETKAPPGVSEIVSKERFAHPERGKSETVNGQLQWEPPQVGTSVRANALGQYVMFTNGSLILHGPPRKPVEHSAFAHYCVGLPLATARRLYTQSYIGTKVKIIPGTAATTTAGVRR